MKGNLCMLSHVWPHGPTKFLYPWYFSGKNTGVGCHFLLQGNLPDQGIELESLASPALPRGFFFLPLRHLSDSWESRSSISSIDKLLLCEACCEVLPRYPFRMKDLFLIPATGRKLWVSPTSGIPLAEEETSPKVIPSSVGSHIQWLISEPWPSTLGKTEQSSQPLSFWHYGWWGLHQSTGHHGFSPYSTMGPFLPFHRCWF